MLSFLHIRECTSNQPMTASMWSQELLKGWEQHNPIFHTFTYWSEAQCTLSLDFPTQPGGAESQISDRFCIDNRISDSLWMTRQSFPSLLYRSLFVVKLLQQWCAAINKLRSIHSCLFAFFSLRLTAVRRSMQEMKSFRSITRLWWVSFCVFTPTVYALNILLLLVFVCRFSLLFSVKVMGNNKSDKMHSCFNAPVNLFHVSLSKCMHVFMDANKPFELTGL